MTSHYDNPLTISYNMGNHDFGAGADALAIKVPPGKTYCRIDEIHVAVKETFTNVTTPAFIRIGTAADADKFAELNMAAAADTNGYGIRDDTDALKDVSDGGSGAIDVSANGENISQLEVAYVAPTGGTPAGIGEVTIVCSWW